MTTTNTSNAYGTLPDLDSFLDAAPAESELDFLDEPTPEVSPLVTLPEGAIDPRLQLLSHSSRSSVHLCPRKYQLYRMNSKDTGVEDSSSSVTFAYGHAVGQGIQSALEGKTETQIFMDVFLAWDYDLLGANPRQKKSIWEAIFAVQKFIAISSQGYLEDYELVYYEGKPAVELSFRVHLPDGFKYRGYVDVVLRHKTTGAILVLELKTSSGAPNSATFKNSGQALGYSVVLDRIFPDMSAYEVLYLVYHTAGREFTEFYFEKSLLQRALWLQELLIDCELIKLYHSYDVYPMHGENCRSFFKDCEYLGLCTLSTINLIKPLTEAMLAKMEAEEYMFDVSFEQLIESQINKGTD